MKKIIAILVVLISFLSFSQKIKMKKGDLIVDDISWLKYQESNNFDVSLINASGDEIIFLKFVKQGVDNMIFGDNVKPNYYEVSFLGLSKKVEIRNLPKQIISIIYNAKIVDDKGVLISEKVDRMVEKYGTSFSDENKKTNNTNTIIIKEEPRRSGININIGR
jgi:hypothetical protein